MESANAPQFSSPTRMPSPVMGPTSPSHMQGKWPGSSYIGSPEAQTGSSFPTIGKSTYSPASSSGSIPAHLPTPSLRDVASTLPPVAEHAAGPGNGPGLQNLPPRPAPSAAPQSPMTHEIVHPAVTSSTSTQVSPNQSHGYSGTQKYNETR